MTSKIVLVLGLALAVGCSGSNGGTSSSSSGTGATSSTSVASSTAATSSSGTSGSVTVASASGSGTGNSTATTSTTGTSGAFTSVATSTVGSSGTSGSSGVTSSSSSSTGTTGLPTYCNGSQLSNAAGTFLVATYPKSDDIRTGCDSAFVGLTDGGANVYANLSGILDVDSYGDAGSAAVYTVFPAGCEDLGVGTGPSLTIAYSAPDGGTSVAASVASAANVALMWGVVTYIAAPYTSATGAHSGQAYLQDLSGAANSGISIYFPKASAPPIGGGAMPGQVGYPAAGLTRGEVVAISNLKWAPYLGQLQFDFQATSAATNLGTAQLPAAVTVTDAQIAPGASPAPSNIGMRVTVAGPNTVINSCPLILKSN